MLHVGPTACPGSISSLSPSHLAAGRPWTLCQQDLALWWLRVRPGIAARAAFEPSHNWEALAVPGQGWGREGALHRAGVSRQDSPEGPALPCSQVDPCTELPAQPVLGHQKSHWRRWLVRCQQTQAWGCRGTGLRYCQHRGAASWKGQEQQPLYEKQP